MAILLPQRPVDVGNHLVYRRDKGVTLMVIVEALAWVIGGTAALIGFIKLVA